MTALKPLNSELEPAMEMDMRYDNIVVECKYFAGEGTHGGGLGGETEHCFGSLTVEPPIDLNTCTSLPSEYTLEGSEQDTLLMP